MARSKREDAAARLAPEDVGHTAPAKETEETPSPEAERAQPETQSSVAYSTISDEMEVAESTTTSGSDNAGTSAQARVPEPRLFSNGMRDPTQGETRPNDERQPAIATIAEEPQATPPPAEDVAQTDTASASRQTTLEGFHHASVKSEPQAQQLQKDTPFGKLVEGLLGHTTQMSVEGSREKSLAGLDTSPGFMPQPHQEQRSIPETYAPKMQDPKGTTRAGKHPKADRRDYAAIKHGVRRTTQGTYLFGDQVCVSQKKRAFPQDLSPYPGNFAHWKKANPYEWCNKTWHMAAAPVVDAWLG